MRKPVDRKQYFMSVCKGRWRWKCHININKYNKAGLSLQGKSEKYLQAEAVSNISESLAVSKRERTNMRNSNLFHTSNLSYYWRILSLFIIVKYAHNARKLPDGLRYSTKSKHKKQLWKHVCGRNLSTEEKLCLYISLFFLDSNSRKNAVCVDWFSF